MEVPKEQILGLLHSRGHTAQAGRADQALPNNVDLERDSGLLSTLGVDPGELLARSVLAKFGLGKITGSRSSRTACREQLKGNAMRRAPEPTTEGDVMTEKHDQPARAEQPGRGGFEEGQQTLPDNEHVGQFSDGNETLPDNEHVGQFSDGNETLPDNEREGQFSNTVEPGDR